MPGPAPKKNARFGVGKSGWVSLPAEGRPGKAPAWPLSGRAPAGWAELWRLPQAVMWERDNAFVQIATYLMTRNAAHEALVNGEPNAALLSELRQIEDRIGLSPMAMRRLQWEIPETSDSRPEGRVINARDRFTKL